MARPPILMVHGPATGAWMWDLWRRHLGAHGWEVMVLDLRGHGISMPTDLASVTLEDYVADIASVAPQIEAARGLAPIIGGWSTGGLLAMMFAATGARVQALLLLSPELPLEAGGKAPIDTVRRFPGDLLGPEAFGLYPGAVARSRDALQGLDDEEIAVLLEKASQEQESGIAYRQVLRGVSVDRKAIGCPVLSLHPEAEKANAEALTAYLGSETLYVPAAGRWSMVRHDPDVVTAAASVDAWLGRQFDSVQEV